MSVPSEYTSARKRLTDFRDEIFELLVGGRVKAGLDAGHSGMQKYSNVVQQLSVTPYMFGEVRQKALALQLKGVNIGSGEIRGVRGDFVMGESEYPLQPPFNVSRRRLPAVDVFSYKAIEDLELLRHTDTASLNSFILLQCPRGTFADTPSISNVSYDYYEFMPSRRWRASGVISSPLHSYVTYHHFKGEFVSLYREVYVKGSYTSNRYEVMLFVDPVLVDDNGNTIHPLVFMSVFGFYPPDDVVISIGGQRVPIKDRGVWLVEQDWAIGTAFIKGGATIGYDPDNPVELWKNHFDVTMQVNEDYMGTTDPLPNSVTTVDAMSLFTMTAYPNSGYRFKCWERDGVEVASENPHTRGIYRDTVVRAVFEEE